MKSSMKKAVIKCRSRIAQHEWSVFKVIVGLASQVDHYHSVTLIPPFFYRRFDPRVSSVCDRGRTAGTTFDGQGDRVIVRGQLISLSQNQTAWLRST